MKAKDVMTRAVETIDKDERLPDVLEMMRKQGLSKIPVTEKGRLVGVLVDGDIADELGAIKNRGIPASQLHVSSAMRRTFPTGAADTPLENVLRMMLDDDAGMVPIVHDGSILGVVTASDLVKRVNSNRSVADLMSKRVLALSPHDRVIHARRLMIDNHVERLPVIDAGRLVGIVGESDIAQGLARFKDQHPTQRQNNQLREFLVEAIMRRQVVTIPETARASEAAGAMTANDVGCLPVMRGDTMVGIVTRTDLLRVLADEGIPA